MVRKRFEGLDAERRGRILDAAAEQFSDRGYDGASINRIIAEAGISKGALYYYFDDKEDLFATVMEQASLLVMDGMGMPPADDLTAETFWNTFRDLMRRSVDYLKANERYVRLVRTFWQLRVKTPSSPATRRILDAGRSQLRTILARGQQLEVVRTDLPLALLVEVALAVDEAGSRWRLEHWNEFSDDERVAHADAQIDLIRDMLHAKNQGWED
ncbi:MAG: helix-turn-helix domain containing protein [Gammaproteobacteria bacterium]|nr:helix-turn-helix domain containing protein [Gammaproteobacteria bacterium]